MILKTPIKLSRHAPKTAHIQKHCPNDEEGFTLIELVVVVVVLGILSGVAIPNVSKIFDFNNIDEVKSLLNAAGADCLQNSRLSGSTKAIEINDAIISNDKLNTIGYEIDSSATTCSYFQLQPLKNSDGIRYNIGFSVSDGTLTKFGNTTENHADNILAVDKSCKGWAGVNCKEDENLKKLVAHKKAIAEAKLACSEQYSNWLTGGTNPNKFQRWNPSADSGCPTRPKNSDFLSSDTCTTNGCNKTVYGLDGEFVGFKEEDYDAALEEKYGKICTEEKQARKDSSYTNPNSSSISIMECGPTQFWFYKGEDVGNELAWEILYHKDNNPTGKQTLSDGSELFLCMREEKPTEELMTQCINDNEEAGCDNQINEKISEQFNGEFVPKSGSPGSCSSVNWMCEGVNYKDNKDQYETNCASSCGDIPNKACENASNYNHPLCKTWTKCKGYI